MTSRIRSRRLALRIAAVGGMVLALFVLPNLRLRAMPVPATTWSVSLGPAVFQASGTGQWDSEELDAEVTLVGLSWTGTAPEAAWVRTDTGDGWSAWLPLVIEAEHGPDPRSPEAAGARPATEPLYVGEVERVQYRVQAAAPERLTAEFVETSARSLGFVERLSHLARRITWRTAEAEAAPGQPTIIPREAWGGDTCIADSDEEPSYTDGVRALFVHHTATANSYGEAGALDAIYAICSYHHHTQGWKDIGYNFLIDRYGNIYEGREGGIDQPVWGAHTGGFNYYSTGVGLLGDFNSVGVPQATIDALVDLAAWKLDLHHADPMAVVEMVSLGSSKFEEGEVVDMNAISGHRDASTTSCPGNLCYPLLTDIRPQVLETGGAKIFGGGPSVVPPVLDQPTTFPFTFTEPMEWTFRLFDPSGTEIVTESGSGSGGEVLWDGLVDGGPAERGAYRVELDAATLDDGEVPTPVRETLVWYNPPFADDDFNLHEPNINAIAAAGITRGCSEYFAWLYCPTSSVRRDQMASFIARALDLPPATADHFADDDGNTHEDAINALAEAGIAAGCGENAYCPFDIVRRDQMASFLARALELEPVDADYFSDDSGSAHEANINAVAAAGVTLGCGDGTTYCPRDIVLRSHMASFLARAFLTE